MRMPGSIVILAQPIKMFGNPRWSYLNLHIMSYLWKIPIWYCRDGTIPLQESLNAYPLIPLPLDLSVYHGQYSSSNLCKNPLETLSYKPIDNIPLGNIRECPLITHIFMDGHEIDNPSGVKITNTQFCRAKGSYLELGEGFPPFGEHLNLQGVQQVFTPPHTQQCTARCTKLCPIMAQYKLVAKEWGWEASHVFLKEKYGFFCRFILT